MMESSEVKQFLKSHKLFAKVSDNQLEQLCPHVEVIELLTGDVLIEDNERQENLYFVVCGTLEAVKHDLLNDRTHRLQAFNQNDTIGELSIIDELTASATISAKTPCRLLKIFRSKISNLNDANLYHAIAKTVTERLRETNDKVMRSLRQELEQSRKLAALGQFITYVLLLISAYNITLQASMALVNNAYTQLFASTSVIFIFTMVLYILMKRSGYRASEYGLTLNGARESLKDSLFYTSILLFMLVMLKYIFLVYTDSDKPLIDMQSAIPVAKFGSAEYFVWLAAGMVVYGLFVPLQEFISRGVMQSSLSRLLRGKHSGAWSVVITSALFSAMHVHISTIMAIVVFIPSLFWGWLYLRRQTLIGPIVSHIMLGWFAIFIIGLDDFI